ncbi:411_t:CDS:2 [Funneliformis geosporum]|uniref:sphingomyelin phosphodiesterase n=1 Tax=Funneliformis geosporum TaxID=1117311 RepID=A0A9W4SJR8_9GLOM|nr:411_t:CDS:2 [Funneliformis geosporum]CAI2171630.1 4843_t:CDS:2 [Funneliformis geosporum]
MSESNEGDSRSKIKARLLTYNLFLRPPLIKNNISDYKEARLEYFIDNVLDNYDIICLEEMFSFGSSRRTRLLEAAEKAGFKYSLTLPCNAAFKLAIDGGLVLLSRFPIIESNTMIYPSGVYSDRFSNKGALYAKIELSPKDVIHLFMTHTQASYISAPPLTEKSVITRQEQLFHFRKFIDKCTLNDHLEEPIILVGDLNVNSRPRPNSPDINGDTAEYLNMIKILSGEGIEANQIDKSASLDERLYNNSKIVKIIDTLKERYGNHPITFGDVILDDNGTIIPRETVLTGKDDLLSQASLDYILLLGDQSKQRIWVDIPRTRVEEFFVNNASSYPFSQLSGM